jgi:hypothetical protein
MHRNLKSRTRNMKSRKVTILSVKKGKRSCTFTDSFAATHRLLKPSYLLHSANQVCFHRRHQAFVPVIGMARAIQLHLAVAIAIRASNLELRPTPDTALSVFAKVNI